MIVPDEIERYAEQHTTGPTQLLEELYEETYATEEWAQMMAGPLQGRLLELLVFGLSARRVLEIGTFTGLWRPLDGGRARGRTATSTRAS